MARVSLVMACSHSPFLFTPPEYWNQIRAKRASCREDVPYESLEEQEAKYQRCLDAYGALAKKIEAARPDVLLIFGDDQGELFNFNNFPALGVYVGEEFEGYRTLASMGYVGVGRAGERKPKTPEHWASVKGCPALAKELMTGLMQRGFDLSFSLGLSNKEDGMGHAFMRPLYHLTPDYRLPVVPFFVNCYYAPQPTARRCFELGHAVRDVIESWPADLDVAVLGSGGLWHTPGQPNSYLDESFDQNMLEAVKHGEARAMADHFDHYQIPEGAESPEMQRRISGGTGMSALGGPWGGSGETRNWIVAAAVADGLQGTVVDYVPIYASPIGAGWAFWDRP
jgi:hypothetical protein